MTIIAEEMTTQWPALLDRVAEGEQITITRQGIPIARLAPVPSPAKMTPAEAVDRLLELRRGIRLNGLSIREMIDEGRKY